MAVGVKSNIPAFLVTIFCRILLGWVGCSGAMALGEPVKPPASFAYILQADSFAKDRKTAVTQLAGCGRDWIILDSVFTAEEKWESEDLTTIRQGKAGRKVVAYLYIGEAEDYRPYWKKEWGKNHRLGASAPAWLGKENPAWKGNYRVHYWDPAWQKIAFEFIEAAISNGFDGVYLDIVDGFEAFEQEGPGESDNRMNPATKQSYRRDMVDFVKAIAGRARSKNPAALVIPQNGSQLLEHPDFREAVDAIGIEDLYTEGNKVQPEEHTKEVVRHLVEFRKAGKPALIVEYPTKDSRIQMVREHCTKEKFVLLVTDRELKTMGSSGR